VQEGNFTSPFFYRIPVEIIAVFMCYMVMLTSASNRTTHKLILHKVCINLNRLYAKRNKDVYVCRFSGSVTFHTLETQILMYHICINTGYTPPTAKSRFIFQASVYIQLTNCKPFVPREKQTEVTTFLPESQKIWERSEYIFSYRTQSFWLPQQIVARNIWKPFRFLCRKEIP
jgi:hypothetical protein